MTERLKQRETPQLQAEKINGRRPDILDHMGAPKGWVVDSTLLSDEVWENIRTSALPITPGGLNPVARLKAKRDMEKWREKFGSGEHELVLLAIPDRETLHGWGVRPVYIEDLKKEAGALLDEGFEALNKKDLDLSEVKRHAYMAVSGATDTK